jgi:hypothetical protein
MTLAGLLLIGVPLAFNASFALLAARFDYPDILRRPTDEVLERFLQGGTGLVLAWWSFAIAAVLFAPLVVMLSEAISDADGTLLAVATTVGVLGSAVQFLGLRPLALSGPLPGARRRRARCRSRATRDR